MYRLLKKEGSARRGEFEDCPRHGADPCLYERSHRRGHQGGGVRLRPERPALPGAAVQHLSPAPAARGRDREKAGGHTEIHRLAGPRPDGQRGLPGVLPGQAAEHQGGGGHLRLPHRRAEDFHGPGGEHAHPVQPGFHHRHGLRRVRGEPRALPVRQGLLRAHRPVACPLQEGDGQAQRYGRTR